MGHSQSDPQIHIREGQLYINEIPEFMVSGEYPYYRDHPKNWHDRLAKMKEGGITCITCAVPWRHHTIVSTGDDPQVVQFDFTGSTQPNRNLQHFLHLIQTLNLRACLNLGPFSDPSLIYGGMPEYIKPETWEPHTFSTPPRNNTPNHSLPSSYRNHLLLRGHKERSKNRWKPLTGDPLPSPHDPQFKSALHTFFIALSKEVLLPQLFPNGSIIAVQIAYQGYFSDGKAPYWVVGDYSYANLQKFWAYLQSKYQSLENFNTIHKKTAQQWKEIIPPSLYLGNKKYHHLQDLLIVQDWVDFQTNRYIEWIREIVTVLNLYGEDSVLDNSTPVTRIPIYLQWESPTNARMGLDVWMSRIQLRKIETETGLHFGFTNWTKSENYHRSSFVRHGLAAKITSTWNRAVNWGLRKHASTKFEYAFTSLYQTLLSCANGVTGYTMTPVVGTASWDATIDDRHSIPYPTHSAIDAYGIAGNKFQLMAGVNKYFSQYFGQEILATHEETLFGLGLYSPYATLAAYAGHDPKVWQRFPLEYPPVFGQDAWIQFHLALQHMRLNYQVVDLEYDEFTLSNKSSKRQPKVLVFISSVFLAKSVQEKLIRYVKNGGILCIFGQFPEFDENFVPCTLLRDNFPLFYPGNPHSSMCVDEKICYMTHDKGTFLFHSKNPLEQGKDARFYLIDFLTRVVMQLRIKLRRKPVIDLKAIPYSEIMATIGRDAFTPKLHNNSLKTINLLLRFLQITGTYRKIDISVRTDYIFRHKIHVHALHHPSQNIQHIFIFSAQTTRTLPVSIHIFQPDLGFSVRIQTNIVGNTAQLIRIHEGDITGLIYSGVNPISHRYEPLYLKVNKQICTSKYPLDLIYLSDANQHEIYTAHGRFTGNCRVTGILEEPILLRNRDHRIFPKSPNN